MSAYIRTYKGCQTKITFQVNFKIQFSRFYFIFSVQLGVQFRNVMKTIQELRVPKARTVAENIKLLRNINELHIIK